MNTDIMDKDSSLTINCKAPRLTLPPINFENSRPGPPQFVIPYAYREKIPVLPWLASQIDAGIRWTLRSAYSVLDSLTKALTGVGISDAFSRSGRIVKYTLGFAALSFIAYTAFKIYRGYNKKPYRKFDSTDVPHLEHRPNMFAPIDPSIGAPNDSRAYSPVVAGEALDLLEELAEVNLEASRLSHRLCGSCKYVHRNCQCVARMDNYVDNLTALSLRSDKKKRQLRTLHRPVGISTFHVGDEITYPYYRDPNLTLTYSIADIFICADTRPSNEAHIRISNTRMFVFRLVGLRHSWYGLLPEFVLRMDGHPMRDLIVSEDIMRNTRRGVLTNKHPQSLVGHIDNGLSVPFNDPAVIKFGASIPRDSFYITLALTNHIYGPYPLNC